MGTEYFFHGINVKLATYYNLVPKPRLVELHGVLQLYFPILQQRP
jgi:hypothetical protein